MLWPNAMPGVFALVMITGDHPRTAIAIAGELGISDDAKALSGIELDPLV